MSAKDRAALILKLHKVCKKHFDLVSPPSDRLVLEHMLYACCLEDSTFEAADEAFARLQEEYFDWNEVRVTTVTELANVCKTLTNPEAGAARVKKALHGVFETYYQFDIDFLKKENLSKAITQFSRFKGVSDFVISYTAQNGLGGHSIPIDDSMLFLMTTLGVINEAEAKKRKIPGLERTIPKNKGVDFSSLVHQLAVAYYKSPFNKDVRSLILTIAPDASERFPKRGAAKRAAAKAAAEAKKAAEVKLAKAKAEAEAAKAKIQAEKDAAKAKAKAAREAAKKKEKAVKEAAKKKAAAQKKKKKSVKKVVKKKPKVVSKKKKTKKKSVVRRVTPKKKKSPTKRLSRKKPR